jgi:putative hemolysin
MKRIFTSTFLIIFIMLMSCAVHATQPTPLDQTQGKPAPVSTEIPQADMPNPASAYCVEQGFKSEIRTAADGSQTGYCIFPDESECDEWAYFRGECGPNVPATEAPDTSVYASWIEYVEANYGFKFRYPPEWTAELDLRNDSMTYQHLLWLRAPEKPVAGVEMIIAFERIGENVGIQRTGIGAGELIERGSVVFLGEPAQRIALVLEGKDMEVMYAHTGAFERGDMRFAISLSYVGVERLGLTPELEQIADLIVASFEWEK